MNKIGTVVEFTADIINLQTLEELFRIEESLNENLVHIQNKYECTVEISRISRASLAFTKNIDVKITFNTILGNYFPCISHLNQFFEKIRHDTRGYLNFKPYCLTVWNKDRGYFSARYLQGDYDLFTAQAQVPNILDHKDFEKNKHANNEPYYPKHVFDEKKFSTLQDEANSEQYAQAKEVGIVGNNLEEAKCCDDKGEFSINSVKHLSQDVQENNEAINSVLKISKLRFINSSCETYKNKPEERCMNIDLSVPWMEKEDTQIYQSLMEDWLEKFSAKVEQLKKRYKASQIRASNNVTIKTDQDDLTLRELVDSNNIEKKEQDDLECKGTGSEVIPRKTSKSRITFKLDCDVEKEQPCDKVNDGSMKISGGDGESEIPQEFPYKDKIPMSLEKEGEDYASLSNDLNNILTDSMLKPERSENFIEECPEELRKQTGESCAPPLTHTEQVVVILRDSEPCQRCLMIYKPVKKFRDQHNVNNSTNRSQNSHHHEPIRRLRNRARGDQQKSENTLFYSFITPKSEGMKRLFLARDGRIKRVERLCNCRISVQDDELRNMENFMKVNVDYCPEFGNHIGCLDMLSRIFSDERNDSRNYRQMVPHTVIIRDQDGNVRKEARSFNYLKLDIQDKQEMKKSVDASFQSKFDKGMTKKAGAVRTEATSKDAKMANPVREKASMSERSHSPKPSDQRLVESKMTSFMEYYMADKKWKNTNHQFLKTEDGTDLKTKRMANEILDSFQAEKGLIVESAVKHTEKSEEKKDSDKKEHTTKGGEEKKECERRRPHQREEDIEKDKKKIKKEKEQSAKKYEKEKSEREQSLQKENAIEKIEEVKDESGDKSDCSEKQITVYGDDHVELKSQVTYSESMYDDDRSMSSSLETIADLTITESSNSNDCQSELSLDFDTSTDDDQRVPQTKATDIEEWIAPASEMVCKDDQSKVENVPEFSKKRSRSILVNRVCKSCKSGFFKLSTKSNRIRARKTPVISKSVSWADPLKDFYQPLTTFKEQFGPVPPYAKFEYFSALVPYTESLFLTVNGTAKGDARVRRIMNICKCDIRATQVNRKLECIYTSMLIEIAYDPQNGNHKGCIKMLTQMLMDEQKTFIPVLVFFPYQAIYSDGAGYRFIKKYVGGAVKGRPSLHSQMITEARGAVANT